MALWYPGSLFLVIAGFVVGFMQKRLASGEEGDQGENEDGENEAVIEMESVEDEDQNIAQDLDYDSDDSFEDLNEETKD